MSDDHFYHVHDQSEVSMNRWIEQTTAQAWVQQAATVIAHQSLVSTKYARFGQSLYKVAQRDDLPAYAVIAYFYPFADLIVPQP